MRNYKFSHPRFIIKTHLLGLLYDQTDHKICKLLYIFKNAYFRNFRTSRWNLPLARKQADPELKHLEGLPGTLLNLHWEPPCYPFVQNMHKYYMNLS